MTTANNRRKKERRMNETVETRLSLVENAVEDLKTSQGNNFVKLFRILEGEGDESGLKTSVKLQSASLKRLYKWVAGLTIIAAGAVEEVIRRNL